MHNMPRILLTFSARLYHDASIFIFLCLFCTIPDCFGQDTRLQQSKRKTAIMIASLASAIPVLLAGLGSLPGVAAADSPYKVDTRDNIIKSASTLAKDIMALYDGNKKGGIPGLLPGGLLPYGKYFWYQGASFMAAYIDYNHLTGDNTYNDIITEGMLHQTGENGDYMPVNYTATMGNDEQCFWALSALLAAENTFPNPPKDKPQWIDLAKKVFEEQASPYRHDDTCGGGLRWQIPMTNSGYDYKNSMANGCYLNLGARLARYTGNNTYADIAAETWDWLIKVKLIDEETYAVYDGGHTGMNCTDINKAQFSINSILLLQGAAFMFNHTNGDKIWRERVTKLTDATLKTFFPDNVAYELACESRQSCTSDMVSFKGLLHRYLASATQVAPFISDAIRLVLRKSTEAAVKTCTGGSSGRECGFYDWSDGKYVEPEDKKSDGADNVLEQINVLAAVESLLIDEAAVPATEKNAGNGGDSNENASETSPAPGPGKTTPAGSAAGRSETQIVSAVMMGLGACAWLVRA